MTKISQLPADGSPTTDDYVVTVDLGTNITKRVTLNDLAKLMFASFDWSLNMKYATLTSNATLTNGTTVNLGSYGLQVTLTVASNCNALVIVTTAETSTSDYESKPAIYLDGSLYATSGYAAAIASASGRSSVRTFNYVLPLTAGAHTIAGGIFTSASTSPGLNTGGANLTVLVLGKVTA